MDKRYQVFVSSTYEDLRAERQEVIQALLELDCIPSGMELFPAADEDQWTLIKRVIDDRDYYIVISAGRYGSIGADGKSYTQMEYEYAISVNKPVIAFLHQDIGKIPNERTEKSDKGKRNLMEFRALMEKKLCKYWTSPAELGGAVSRSIIKLIKAHPAIGWVKADLVPDESADKEILELSRQVAELENQLELLRNEPPLGSEELAQGDDLFEMRYVCDVSGVSVVDGYQKDVADSYDFTWNEIFLRIAPMMLDEVSEQDLIKELNEMILNRDLSQKKDPEDYEYEIGNVVVFSDDFQTIKVQLRSLGLIVQGNKPRSAKDTNIYWKLTPYGDAVMTKGRAIKKHK
ncbi:MAG: hypothetical protein CVT49_11600 [candidate division Zixibacteria bacterium HGW-Zixibacteria-1]|nr:MAG: hypothetical protein CVT49_11600 [candidate division Zixibacteria bacterium HGW-Zixibacteria-1]